MFTYNYDGHTYTSDVDAQATNYKDTVRYEVKTTREDGEPALLYWDMTPEFAAADERIRTAGYDDYEGRLEDEMLVADEANACDWDNPAGAEEL